MNKAAAGRASEGLAEAHLRSLGYGILARNYRCRYGEVDLVAREGGTLVFVEVRGRSGRSHGTPEESVTVRKQQHLWRVAQHYLQRVRGPVPECRFDVVAVDSAQTGGTELRLIRDAFRGGA